MGYNALQARKRIRTLHRKEPDVRIEIRWCPSNQGIEGNEKADGWAKLKREFSEAKWNEAKEWSYSRTNSKKYRPSKKQPS